MSEHDLSVVSVLSGNRNFEGRIHPDVKQNFLASPRSWSPTPSPGRSTSTFERAARCDQEGQPVMLADLWPSDAEVALRYAPDHAHVRAALRQRLQR